MHLLAERQDPVDGSQGPVVLPAERERIGHPEGSLRAGLQLRMEASAEFEGEDRVDPQADRSQARLQDGAQLPSALRRFVLRRDPGQLAVQGQVQPTERRLEQPRLDAQLGPCIVVRPFRTQSGLQVRARLEPIRQAQVGLEREVRDVVSGQLARHGWLLGPAQHAVQMDLDPRRQRRRSAGIVDLDLEGILCAGGRGAEQHQDQAAHRSTVRRNVWVRPYSGQDWRSPWQASVT